MKKKIILASLLVVLVVAAVIAAMVLPRLLKNDEHITPSSFVVSTSTASVEEPTTSVEDTTSISTASVEESTTSVEDSTSISTASVEPTTSTSTVTSTTSVVHTPAFPYTKDGRIYIDVREDPNAAQCVILCDLNDCNNMAEAWEMGEEQEKYAKYIPVIGEITANFPMFPEEMFTVPLFDGGTYYVHEPEKFKDNLLGTLSHLVAFSLYDREDRGGGCWYFRPEKESYLPWEEGVNFIGEYAHGEVRYVIRFYMYEVE